MLSSYLVFVVKVFSQLNTGMLKQQYTVKCVYITHLMIIITINTGRQDRLEGVLI